MRPRLSRFFRYASAPSGHAEASGIPVSYGLPGIGRVLKRMLDILVSAVLLLLLFPVMAVIACLVRWQSAGPSFFRQVRMGRGGEAFICYKFRSMYPGSETRQVFLKRKGDPNVTPVGVFIRRWSLDELPQLLNVLKGDMSLVGPRPLPLGHHESLGEAGLARLAVVPGLTGLWQVSGRSSLSHDEMVSLDMEYIIGWSLWLDLRILARTPGAILSGRGAY